MTEINSIIFHTDRSFHDRFEDGMRVAITTVAF